MNEQKSLLEHHIEDDKDQFSEINRKLDTLLEAQNRQKGFVAGFSAAFSLLFTMVIGLVVYIWNR